MARFNTSDTKPAKKAPVKATGVKTVNHAGGPGYLRDEESDLFLLAVTNFYGQNLFYEKGSDRDDRYAKLIRKVALQDPEWVVKLLTWLRGPEGNIRTAAIVGACEFVKARLDAKAESNGLNRQVISSVLQRADEPGELLAYWTSRYGKNIPKPVKRGVADAVKRLYNEYALLKYDGGGSNKSFRFGDVLELVHAKPDAAKSWQGDLFRFAIDRRHNRVGDIPNSLKMIRSNVDFRRRVHETPELLYSPEALKEAGFTWENALSMAGEFKADQTKVWEALAPDNMGYMALLRNLRNFDQAGMSDKIARKVADKISDPVQVAKSRQFPFRFYAAQKSVPSQRWGHALDVALGYSMQNLPEFTGKTLVLVDTSGSMERSNYSEKSEMRYIDSAVLFGIALALRNPGVDLYGFATGQFSHQVSKGGSILREVERFTNRVGAAGHGTEIARAVQQQYRNHDRIVILTDMQTFGGGMWSYYTGDVNKAVSPKVPIYAFNLAGYSTSAIESGSPNRYELGGVTDATFKQITLLERGRNANWPWED